MAGQKQKAIIGINRWTKGLAFSGGSWTTEYPLSNLTDTPLSRVARSTGLSTGATRFTAELPESESARPVQLVTLVRHNLSPDADIRLRVYEDVDQTIELYDSGYQKVMPKVTTAEFVLWTDDNFWSLKYEDGTTSRISHNLNLSRPFVLDGIYTARSFLLEIDDQTNPDGYVDLGMFDIARGWQLGINFAYGAQFGWRERSKVTEAYGGGKYFEYRPKPRTFRGEVKNMEHDEAMIRAFEHQREFDVTEPFVWLPTPGDSLHWVRNTFLARNKNLGMIGHVQYDYDSVPLNLEEVLE